MMREDLIERLRELIDNRCGDGPSGPNYDPELLDVLSEAAAAIESAPALESNAPVGVVEAFEEYHKADHRDPAVALEWEWWQAAWKAALAQQPAATDEAIRRDAERYRWLRENGRGDLDILWVYQGEELDRLIDSEISREKGANP